jgi:hypothetical protein
MKPRYLALALLGLFALGCDVASRHTTTRFDVTGHVRDVAAYKDTLLAATDVSLLTYDISEPESPRALGVVALGHRRHRLRDNRLPHRRRSCDSASLRWDKPGRVRADDGLDEAVRRRR